MRITVPAGIQPGMSFQVAVPAAPRPQVVPAVPVPMPMAAQPMPMQVPNPNAMAQQQKELDFYRQQQAMAAQPVQQAPQFNQTKTVQVTIPSGVRAGSRMTVRLPNGQNAQVTVPQGMGPGMKMSINYQDNSAPPVQQQVQQPLPVRPQPVMPVMPVMPAPSQSRKVQKSVSITIPQGVRPGNKITVNLPNGKQAQVTVPNGTRPGNKITINYVDDSAPPARQQPQMAPQMPAVMRQPAQAQKEKRSVTITIPQGVRPGNKITVNLPDGRQVQVTVPQGMKPGNKMTVNCALVMFLFIFFLNYYLSLSFIELCYSK